MRYLFQSRNRGSFDFKMSTIVPTVCSEPEFQSRNRGSFDFKISSSARSCKAFMFQSRNRGSFDFKAEIIVHINQRRTYVSIS